MVHQVFALLKKRGGVYNGASNSSERKSTTVEFSASTPLAYTSPPPMRPEQVISPLVLGRGESVRGNCSLQLWCMNSVS